MRDNIKSNLILSFNDLRSDIISQTHINEVSDMLEQEVYKVLHHTDPDKNTRRVFENIKDKYFYGNKSIKIAGNHY